VLVVYAGLIGAAAVEFSKTPTGFYALPYRRFVAVLADANARLGVDVDRYSFIVVDLHHLLLADLPAHFESHMPSQSVRSLWAMSGLQKYVRHSLRGASHLVKRVLVDGSCAGVAAHLPGEGLDRRPGSAEADIGGDAGDLFDRRPRRNCVNCRLNSLDLGRLGSRNGLSQGRP
jgi:hypothetical protein